MRATLSLTDGTRSTLSPISVCCVVRFVILGPEAGLGINVHIPFLPPKLLWENIKSFISSALWSSLTRKNIEVGDCQLQSLLTHSVKCIVLSILLSFRVALSSIDVLNEACIRFPYTCRTRSNSLLLSSLKLWVRDSEKIVFYFLVLCSGICSNKSAPVCKPTIRLWYDLMLKTRLSK